MKTLTIIVCLLLTFSLKAQNKFLGNISTVDVTNFWITYDSVVNTTDTLKQNKFIQNLYLDKATVGLMIFLAIRKPTIEYIRKTIFRYPKFWRSIRNKTLDTDKYSVELENCIKNFKRVYSVFFLPDIYFIVGLLRQGGYAQNDAIFIGIELESADYSVDLSELTPSLQKILKLNKNYIFTLIHEFVHIQQKINNDTNINLLASSIQEGAADFIAEIVTTHTLASQYLDYGKLHENEIWLKFKKDMWGRNLNKWLRNNKDESIEQADLGYFVGYEICKSYYKYAFNKQKAIKEIIDLDYSNQKSVNQFLVDSKYENKPKT